MITKRAVEERYLTDPEFHARVEKVVNYLIIANANIAQNPNGRDRSLVTKAVAYGIFHAEDDK